MLFVNAAHERGSEWQDFVDKDEDCLFRGELDALANHVYKLTHGQIRWHQVLFLVDRRDVAFLDFLDDHWDSVGILLALWEDTKVS